MPKTAVVTGTCRGRGTAFTPELVRGLAAHVGADGVVHLVVPDDGQAAAATAALAGAGPCVAVHPLHPADAAAPARLAADIAAAGTGVDIVVTDTAVAVDPDLTMAAQVRGYIAGNNEALHRLMAAFSPHLTDHARFVVVTGMLGSLDHLPHRLRARFADDDAGFAHLDTVLAEYADAVETGRAAAEGWPAWIDVASSIGRVAAARLLARTLAERRAGRPGPLVNAVGRAPAAHGADPGVDRATAADVLWAATLPVGTREPYGQLLHRRSPVPFVYTPAA